MVAALWEMQQSLYQMMIVLCGSYCPWRVAHNHLLTWALSVPIVAQNVLNRTGLCWWSHHEWNSVWLQWIHVFQVFWEQCWIPWKTGKIDWSLAVSPILFVLSSRVVITGRSAGSGGSNEIENLVDIFVKEIRYVFLVFRIKYRCGTVTVDNECLGSADFSVCALVIWSIREQFWLFEQHRQ